MDYLPRAPTDVRAKPRPFEHWLVLALVLAAFAIVVALGVAFQPDPRGFGTHEQLGLPPCKMMEWWGVPCPGCGVTTSIALVAHGRFLAGFHNQPFGFLCALAIPVLALWAIVMTISGRDLSAVVNALRPGRAWLVLAGIVALSWAWKLALVRGWVA